MEIAILRISIIGIKHRKCARDRLLSGKAQAEVFFFSLHFNGILNNVRIVIPHSELTCKVACTIIDLHDLLNQICWLIRNSQMSSPHVQNISIIL